MSNTYTYKAKRINWEDNKEDQYVTGNIITIGARCFIVNPKFTYDYDYGYSYSSPGISFDDYGFIEVDRNTIEPFVDQKKAVWLDVITELTYLTDATTEEELTALCEACDYDYNTLSEWDKECKLEFASIYVHKSQNDSNDFSHALKASYNDNDALFDFAREYKKSINRKNN